MAFSFTVEERSDILSSVSQKNLNFQMNSLVADMTETILFNRYFYCVITFHVPCLGRVQCCKDILFVNPIFVQYKTILLKNNFFFKFQTEEESSIKRLKNIPCKLEFVLVSAVKNNIKKELNRYKKVRFKIT